jgi:D-arabinose 1-dehydrogenase-like Zn-dependent alcohol dehydrogenase
LIRGRKSIQGWPSATATDSEDTLRFCRLTGVRTMSEKYLLAKANEAYARMMTGKAEFRVVLIMCEPYLSGGSRLGCGGRTQA